MRFPDWVSFKTALALLSCAAFVFPAYPAMAADEEAGQVANDSRGKPEKKKSEEENAEQTPEELAEVEPAVGPAAFGISPLLVGAGGAAAAGGIAAAAAGGGGGSESGGDGGGGSNPPPGNTPAPPPSAPVAEADAQGGLFTINAFGGQELGTGDGIAIGFMDSGIDYAHSEFAGRIADADCYDAETDQTGCENISIQAHGTHVAGIAAAARNNVGMMGVAFDARIVNADIFTSAGFGVNADARAKALNWIVGRGANITNHSYAIVGVDGVNLTIGTYGDLNDFNPATTDIGKAYQNAVDKHVILVWATGNSGLDQPGVLSALPLEYTEWAENWVAVTATNESGTARASYANACGDAKDFCIAAPGGDSDGRILSAYPGGGYGIAAGTSMAAPHVSGALAVLMEIHGPGTVSDKPPEEIVDLMFETANDEGIFADSNIFGHGLLDLEKAATTDLSTAAIAGASLLQDTNVSFGAAFGDAGIQALAGLETRVQDNLGRAFMVDLGGLSFTPDAGTDSKKLLRNYGTREVTNIALSAQSSLQLSFESGRAQPGALTNNGEDRQIRSMRFTSQLADQAEMSFSYGLRPGEMIGIADSGAFDASLLNASEQTLNPYFDFAGERAYSAGFDAAPGAGPITFRSLAFMSEQSEEDPFYGDTDGQDDSVFGFAGGTDMALGPFTLSLLTGMTQEEEQTLGLSGEGGFATENGTQTFYAGPAFKLKIGERMQLAGSWQTGWTDPEEVENSLFSDFSPIQSESFTLGVTGRGGWKESDSWGVFAHQPLRVSESEATLEIAEGRADDGSIVTRREKIDLSPSGRELNFQGFYTSAIDEDRSFSAGLMVRLEPGHVKDASTEGVGLVRYRMQF